MPHAISAEGIVRRSPGTIGAVTSSLGVFAAIVVGTAFLLAGGAKLAAGRAWPEQARELGAPSSVVAIVPWIEIVVGGLLAAQVARPVLGTIALAMLLAFSALLLLRLSQGKRPPCACFGSWNAQPLGWRHLARNAALITLAIVALAA